MAQYRIVSEKTINSAREEKKFFYIQKSTSWLKRRMGTYWKFIYYTEDVKHNRPVFESYQEAEEYLYKNYFRGYGEVFKNGNVFSFREYYFGF